MDFFEAQDNARRTSKWLVVVYLLVTALIVASVYKRAVLYSGGGKVVAALGGTPLWDDDTDPR